MSTNRVQIDEDVMGTICGGRICYRGKQGGLHYLYSNENPSAKYSYDEKRFGEIGKAENECYGQSDEYFINYLLNLGLITPM